MPKLIDITGQKFNNWFVLNLNGKKDEYRRLLWNCECLECHKIYSIPANVLKTRKSVPCANCERIAKNLIRERNSNLTGQQFGNWIVLNKSKYTNRHGADFYKCKCLSCNQIYCVIVSTLMIEKSKQCQKCTDKAKAKNKRNRKRNNNENKIS